MSQVWSGHGLIKAIMLSLSFSLNSFLFYMISLISLTIHFDKEDEINVRNILIRTQPKNVECSFSTRKNRIDVLENTIVPTAGFYSLTIFIYIPLIGLVGFLSLWERDKIHLGAYENRTEILEILMALLIYYLTTSRTEFLRSPQFFIFSK